MKLSDYVGCNLFSFLYAVPLLKHHEASFITSTCLRNTPAWKSIDSFNNESIMINDSERLFKLLQVKYAGNFEDPLELCLHPWALGNYLKWSSPAHGAHSFNMLLPRAAFCNWLYGLFFKLALPAIRGHNCMAFGASMMVYSPCTLVVFFRLLMHLRSIGYPSHWLSTVLGSILADNVSTSARPPVTCPLDIQEVNCHKPPKRITTSPYVAEMSTLTTLFLRLLPFAVYGSEVDIPSPQSIRECTVQFQKVDVLTDSNRPDFVLVFTKLSLMQDAAPRRKLDKPQYMRDLLQDDRLLDQHKHSIVMMSTWKWDPVVQQAVFWMREDVVNSILDSAGQWICEINRTDNWLSASDNHIPTMDRTTLKLGKRWVDEPAADDFQNLPVRTL
jgi:hypothetical protein